MAFDSCGPSAPPRLFPKTAVVILLAGLLAANPRFAQASPATFVTALPVAQSQALLRLNWDTAYGGQNFTGLQFPIDLAYGLNAKWTIFTTYTPMHSSIRTQAPSGGETVAGGGMGDTLAFIRYTLFSRDSPKSTARLAPLAGLSLPSGSNTLHNAAGLLPGPIQTGSGAVAPYAGVAFGLNNAAYGFAADSTIRANPITRTGVSPGDQFRADGQAELRLTPRTLPDYGLPKELWISIEENYQHDALSHTAGRISPGSGGQSFYQDAVLEFATLHYEVGAGLQLPLWQDLNSPEDVREDRQVLFFTEYYFSGFMRHRP
jgi:hypothetical protein